MAIGIFTDKNKRPTNTEILKAIGSRLSLWHELVHFIHINYPVKEDFKFMYGKNYGWALRFLIKKRLCVSLYPVKGGFTVQIILNSKAIQKTQG